MTDLEIIKNEVKNFGEQSIQTSLDIIVTTAERMAAEIERLKEEVNERQVIYYIVLKESKQYRNEAVCLKAELRKIVRCGECKNWKQTYVDPELGECPFRSSGNSFSMMFCWNGQRKSEVGK